MCYSFGTQKKLSEKKNQVPGPGSYSSTVKSIKQDAPSWKLGTQERESFQASKTPGPGSYQPPSQVILSTRIKYTFGLKPQTYDKSFVPGPGSYSYRLINNEKQKPPKYSMGLKLEQEQQINKSPGPGSYQFKSNINNVPSSKIGKEKRKGIALNTVSLGPGSYSQARASSAPKYGFGTEKRDNKGLKPYPPGKFLLKDLGLISIMVILEVLVELQWYRVARVNQKNNKEKYLDQAHTSLINELHKQLQSSLYQKYKNELRIGTEKRDFNKQNKQPGPGSYQNTFVDKSTAPIYKLGTAMQRPISANAKQPGPGSYEYKMRLTDGPKWGFRLKPQINQKSDIPGAGSYNTNYKQTLSNNPRYVFDKESRDSRSWQTASATPGVGNYQMRKGFNGPKWGFGTSLRSFNKRDKKPGPGDYNIYGTIGKVPKYLIQNQTYY